MNLKKVIYAKLQSMTVDEYQKYLEEAKQGYIEIASHPEDENILILNYTEKTVYERRWNEQTMNARGLIIDTSNAINNDIKILAKPFPKFFNYGENPEYEADIDFTEQPQVFEKMDGSLGISYFFNNEIRFATRGSFTSEQALKATEIWRNKYAKHVTPIYFLYTHLVEIIYPENRIVVNYNGMEDLVMLGMVDLRDGSELPYTLVKMITEKFEMPIAKQYDLTLEKMLEMKKKISANEEGWVLKFSNGKRLKIKGDEYLQVHRVLHGLSDKAKVEAWAKGELEQLIMAIPEEFRPELESLGKHLDECVRIKKRALNSVFQKIKHKERKDFALEVNRIIEPQDRKFMFNAYDNGEISEGMIKKDIYKSYRDYLEGAIV